MLSSKLHITDPLQLGYALERQLCLDSFYEFVQSFWGEIIAETPVFNWHIEYLCSELQELAGFIVRKERKPYDIIINIPPGTTKTTIVTIMFPAWLWTQAPWIRIISNSYSGDLSIDHASKSKDIITSAKYKLFFPNVIIRRDNSGKGAYVNTEKGARYTTSTGGTITGRHAHILLNDDPTNPKQADSDTERETANRHTQTLSSRKVDKKGTPMITIMQRLHENDVTGFLLAKKAEHIRHICLPAEVSDMVSPAYLKEKYIDGLLDVSRLDREVLDEAKIDLGSRAYAGQYDQNPVAVGGNIVQNSWFRYMRREDFDKINTKNAKVTFFLDTAFTEKTNNDPTGIIATCELDGDLYILHAEKVRLKFPDLCRHIPEYVKAHGYTERSTIRIEPKANGISVVHQIKESTRLNVTEIKSDLLSDSKETRLNGVSPKIECGRVVLIRGGWNEEFVTEICGFPAKTHDEYVDLISYAIDYHLQPKQEPQDFEELESMLY